MSNNECFTLSLRDGKVYVVPHDAAHHPLLAKLYISEEEATVPAGWLAEPVSVGLAEQAAWMLEIALEFDLGLRVVSQSDVEIVCELTDLKAEWAAKSVDLTSRFNARGIPALGVTWEASRRVKTWGRSTLSEGGIFLRGHIDPLLCMKRGDTVTDAECDAAVDAAIEKLGDPEKLIWNMDQLLDSEDGESFGRLGRGIYKGVACGPWIVAVMDKGIENVYYGDREAYQTDWHHQCNGVDVGSIVEGSDVEVSRDPLLFPFTHDELWETIKGIDEEADFYWHRDNDTLLSVLKDGQQVLLIICEQFDQPKVAHSDVEEGVDVGALTQAAVDAAEQLFGGDEAIPVPGFDGYTVEVLDQSDCIY